MRKAVILFIEERFFTRDLQEAFMRGLKPGDIVLVPDGFRWTELDSETMTVNERGMMFEWTPEGIRLLEPKEEKTA